MHRLGWSDIRLSRVTDYPWAVRFSEVTGSGWNCQPWPSRSQNWMFVHSIIIFSRSQQFPTSSSQNQVELGEWATGHFMHWTELVNRKLHWWLVRNLILSKPWKSLRNFHKSIVYMSENAFTFWAHEQVPGSQSIWHFLPLEVAWGQVAPWWRNWVNGFKQKVVFFTRNIVSWN